MTEILLGVILALLIAAGVLLVMLWRRVAADPGVAPLQAKVEALAGNAERLERSVREEISRNREESARSAGELRKEVNESLSSSTNTLVNTINQLTTNQKDQLEIFAGQLITFTRNTREDMDKARSAAADQSRTLTETLERKLSEQRTAVDAQFKAIQEDNAKRLEAMRQTVDEKLQGTLEKRLGESFKLVSERLEQVHKGLGEMQSLASGVGDLKRVLTNVKTRGTWGEMQLGNLLEQILTPDQYDTNVATKPGSQERVEFAVKLPDREGEAGAFVWVPIDAKFPVEDYLSIVEASERNDPAALEQAVRALDARLRQCAKAVHDKYIDPPRTTTFAILYLPSEGLYAEALRRPGLWEQLQRDYHIAITGPATLSAYLNSLQMGFRTLAMRRQASEIARVLGAVKTEFGKFAEVLGAVKAKLDQASSTLEKAEVRTRQIARKLRDVEALPAAEAQALLPAPEEDDEAGPAEQG